MRFVGLASSVLVLTLDHRHAHLQSGCTFRTLGPPTDLVNDLTRRVAGRVSAAAKTTEPAVLRWRTRSLQG